MELCVGACLFVGSADLDFFAFLLFCCLGCSIPSFFVVAGKERDV